MRRINTDIGFTLFIFIGVWAWIESLKKRPRLSYLAGLFFGLAVMIKGLSAAPFLVAIFISLFLDFKRENLVNFFKLVGIFLVVILPWHLLAYLTYGNDFLRVYVLENILKRSKYPVEFHRERWWFYFVLLYRELTPWIFAFFILPIITAIKFITIITQGSKIKKEIKENALLYTIILLILIPLAFITKAQTRLAWYAMPIYPFLAIYLAYNIDFILKKFKAQWFFVVIVLLIAADASRPIINETRLTRGVETVSPRYDVAFKLREQPHKEVNYLVAYGERQAPLLLPPQETMPQTFVFGGHPCMLYYSEKKVNYFYKVEEFEKTLLQKKGLYVVPNPDFGSIKKEGVKVLYQNPEFTLFEKK